MTENHPTSTELSMAKHLFDPRPTQDSRYIFLDKEIICIECFKQLLQLNASNIKELKLIFVKHRRLTMLRGLPFRKDVGL